MNSENQLKSSKKHKDAAKVRVPPPLVYIVSILIGLGIQSFLWPVVLDFDYTYRLIVAISLAVFGFGIILISFKLFIKTGQNPEPWTATPEIIINGIYRYTRNPMYLGLCLIQAAIGIGVANIWILVLVPVSLFLIYHTAIKKEEVYLEEKFGESYINYKKQVRRWI